MHFWPKYSSAGGGGVRVKIVNSKEEAPLPPLPTYDCSVTLTWVYSEMFSISKEIEI